MIRKYLLLGVILTLPLAACAKKVTSDKIVEDVVVAMCKKMVTCQPDTMPNEDTCKTTMKTALAANKELPKVQTTQKQLDSCTASINKSDCANLLGAKPPEGCEFLQ